MVWRFQSVMSHMHWHAQSRAMCALMVQASCSESAAKRLLTQCSALCPGTECTLCFSRHKHAMFIQCI
jgi:hypothetical protein